MYSTSIVIISQKLNYFLLILFYPANTNGNIEFISVLIAFILDQFHID